MDLLDGLNPQQIEAVTHAGGALLILAGAGSGKTRVITHRMAYLIQKRSVPGPSILAVTFTNKAAGEMRDRVMALVRGLAAAGYGPQVSTFHSFCVRLLRRDGASLAELRPGFTPSFTIYDDDDQLTLIKQSFRHAGLDEQFLKYRSALSWISAAKNQKQGPEDLARDSADPKKAKLAVIFEQYEQRLRQANALDFDDLLLESVRLLRHDDAVRQAWNRRIEHLLIDEYQDTNRSQYELMRLLSKGNASVCVVGDEDQSIYGWRGADIRNILDFESDYPDAKVIRLEQNYRSTGTILKAAGAVVARNKQRKGKNLWTAAGDGDKIGLFEAADAEQEALWIADTVEREIRRDPATRVAVLYRTNSQSRQIEEALRRYNRKYIVVGGFSFYQRAEVKDAMAYLKLLASPQDSLSLLRIINTPARGIGKSTVEELERHAAAHGLSLWAAIEDLLARQQFSPRAAAALGAFRSMIDEVRREMDALGPHQLLRRVLDLSGYWKTVEDDPSPDAESRLQNLSELINAAAEAADRGETLAEFLDHAALAADSDSLDEQSQVSLLTMHNAKGLEFPIVFVAGLEEGLFPHSRARDSAEALEEERRLCYVAMTRAERRLYLSYARFRRRFGSGVPDASIPSRFLNEVPPDMLEVLSEGAPRVNGVDLFGEQHYVRETVKRNLFTGKTYNSVENIAQFFADRGLPLPSAAAPARTTPGRVVPFRTPAPAKPKPSAAGIRVGSVVNHPKYGRGTVLRREGDGDDAKLTIQFARHGLKKLVQKFAGITVKE
jgi:DNA helicase-2/ATP-dependent DNA helicase PcrA